MDDGGYSTVIVAAGFSRRLRLPTQRIVVRVSEPGAFAVVEPFLAFAAIRTRRDRFLKLNRIPAREGKFRRELARFCTPKAEYPDPTGSQQKLPGTVIFAALARSWLWWSSLCQGTDRC